MNDANMLFLIPRFILTLNILIGCSNPKHIIDKKGITLNTMGSEDIQKDTLFDPHDKSPPDPPAQLTASATGPYSIVLKWHAALDGGKADRIKTYRIYRNDQPVSEVSGESLAYEDSGLLPNTDYNFSVSAIDLGSNESAKSPTLTSKTHPISGESLYQAFCENCHGDLAHSEKKDRSATAINDALLSVESMTPLRDKLTQEHIELIAMSLSSQKITLEDTNPPGNFKALATSPLSAVMTWDPKSPRNGGFALLGYHIFRDGQKLHSVDVTKNQFTDESLEPGKTYVFQISASYAGEKETLKSSGQSIVTPTVSDLNAPPHPPKNIAGKVLSATSVEITWQQDSSPSPIAGYHIYVNGSRYISVPPTLNKTTLLHLTSSSNLSFAMSSYSSKGSESSQVGPIMLTTPPADGAQLFTTHCQGCHTPSSKENRSGTAIQEAIKNLAVMNSLTFLGADDIGAIAQSLRKTVDDIPPTAPSSLSITATSATSITLQWTGSSDTGGSDLKGYRVFRNNSMITQVSPGSTGYIDSGLLANQTYTYKVIAVDFANNESQASNMVTGTTLSANIPDTQKPSTPAGLAGFNIKRNEISLKWDPSTDGSGSGIFGYKVYKFGILTATLNANTTTWTDTQLLPATDYKYKVLSVDNAGNESIPSSEIILKTLPPPTGTELYSENCASCHQPLNFSTKKNRSLAQLNTAISTIPTMQVLSVLTDSQRALIVEALLVKPPPPGESSFQYLIPIGTRIFVESRLARVFLLNGSLDPSITAHFENISLKPSVFGGPCGYYDKACPPKLPPTIETLEASMMPEINVLRIGYRFKACGALTSSNVGINNALQNASMVSTSPISDVGIDKLYSLFYPGKIPNSEVKIALTNLYNRTKSLVTSNQSLEGWRMVLYSLCTSIEFDSF